MLIGLNVTIIISVLIGLYFLPSMIAHHKRIDHSDEIFLCNLLLGWTGIIWCMLLQETLIL